MAGDSRGRDDDRVVPRSPTGRIPQWVLDEAVGRPVAPVPWRAAASGGTGGRRPRRARSRSRSLLTVVLVALLVAVSLVLHPPTAQRTGVLATGAAARSAPPAGAGEQGGSRAAAPPVRDGHGFRYLGHQSVGVAPITWSPCRAIHYVTRPAHMPTGGAELLRSAVDQVSAATGLRFVDDGTADEAPSEDRAAYQPDRYGDRWAPVLVAWATPQEVPDFGVDVAGEAGPAWVMTPSGDRAYVSGTVYLDAAKLAAASPAVARAVVLHELGHLVGLAHVDDRNQLMFPQAGTVPSYGAGDLTGLAALGRGACQPDV